MNKYFYCYSLKLKNFLKLQGIRYYKNNVHKNGNSYWMFEYTEELKSALSKWDEYKKFINRKE